MMSKRIFRYKATCQKCKHNWIRELNNDASVVCSKCRSKKIKIKKSYSWPCNKCKKIVLLSEFRAMPNGWIHNYNCKECTKKAMRKNVKRWRERPENRLKEKKHRFDLKLEVFKHYSNGIPHCACQYCDEDNIFALTLEHKNNSGAEHRRKIFGVRTAAGEKMYRWARKNNFPPMFEVLCWNCNASRGMFSKDYHELMIEEYLNKL